ncbi:unnamed protein product, partial [Symbiodinium sp. CCMP2592]
MEPQEAAEAEADAVKAPADAVNQAQLEADSTLLTGDLPGTAAARATRRGGAAAARALGARFATELFNPRSAMAPISHQTKGDLALMLGETTVMQTTPKLRRDFQEVADGGAV